MSRTQQQGLMPKLFNKLFGTTKQLAEKNAFNLALCQGMTSVVPDKFFKIFPGL